MKWTLFSKEKSQGDILEDSKQTKRFIDVIFNYCQGGFIAAGVVKGRIEALPSHLNALISDIKKGMSQDEQQQQEFKASIRKVIEGLKGRIEKLKLEIEDLKRRLADEERKIRLCEDEISEIKAHPEKITTKPGDKIGLAIGICIVIILSLYLFVFYSSACYSAFFKQFEINDIGVINAIFDANAFSNALNDGFTEVLFIGAMPFIFMGLGYLIFIFSKEGRCSDYLKLAAIVLVTLVFDGLLAYKITEEIYNITRQNSFEQMPVYNLKFAFSNLTFYLIICCGFLVYIIWGIVLKYVMDSYANLDKVNIAIDSVKHKIKMSKDKCEQINSDIHSTESEINETETEIKQKEIDIESILVDKQYIKQAVNEFMTGWLTYLSNACLEDVTSKQQEARRIADEIINANL